MTRDKKNSAPISAGMALAFLLNSILSAPASAETFPSNGWIHLSESSQSRPLKLVIRSEHSKAYGWKAGEKINLKAFVKDSSGKAVYLKDNAGQTLWAVTLNENGEAAVSLELDRSNYSGQVHVQAGSRELFEAPLESGVPDGRWIQKIRDYGFSDGTRLRVHYTDEVLEKYNTGADFPAKVLDAAVMAYQTITQFEGFQADGFSFAHPDRTYAADPDRIIDIYLGDPAGENGYAELGSRNKLFRDAPCFDTIQVSPNVYNAVIFLPANYHEFIRNWERLNPSTLGQRHLEQDLRGTLIHEMLHVIVFYYNKNLNKPRHAAGETQTPEGRLDWYVEGLARYFETLAGANHDFYSEGFKQTLPDKIRFSRGGSNYFMRYPDQAFFQLRYENALFWRFIHYRYGMEAIERMSRELRAEKPDFKKAFEKITGEPFSRLLKDYALAVLMKDFGLKGEGENLHEVARTRLLYKNGDWRLQDGQQNTRSLGKSCRLDWVGSWESVGQRFGEPSAGGDSTEAADISGWATDYVEIQLHPAENRIPNAYIRHEGEGEALWVQILCITRGGSTLYRETEVSRGRARSLGLQELVSQNGLQAKNLEKIYLLVTNSDPGLTAPYEIGLSA